jgi:hypothetical protein
MLVRKFLQPKRFKPYVGGHQPPKTFYIIDLLGCFVSECGFDLSVTIVAL